MGPGHGREYGLLLLIDRQDHIYGAAVFCEDKASPPYCGCDALHVRAGGLQSSLTRPDSFSQHFTRSTASGVSDLPEAGPVVPLYNRVTNRP